MQTIQSNLATNALLANVPVWVTENNVNADYDAGNGISACNPGQTFVTDLRGSSPFFAAWRPYVFSQLGKAGVQALYHWDFDADQQFGEVDYNNDARQLSYWVDYWLGQMFPAAAGSTLLSYTSTDDADLETLPVLNTDGSVVVMISNHTIDNPASDNNGPGVAQNVLVDVSALGSFSSASLLVIDKQYQRDERPSFDFGYTCGADYHPSKRIFRRISHPQAVTGGLCKEFHHRGFREHRGRNQSIFCVLGAWFGILLSVGNRGPPGAPFRPASAFAFLSLRVDCLGA